MNQSKVTTKKIVQVGNSFGLVIPKVWLDEMGLTLGDFIVLKKDLNKIVFDSTMLTHADVEKEIKQVEEAIKA